MPPLCDELRPFWLRGLHTVTGRQTGGLAAFLINGDFQVYHPLSASGALLSVATPNAIQELVAAECSRMGVAAIESIEHLVSSKALPRNTGWLVVRSYYAGFFAAHAILRMLGHGISQLDDEATRAVVDIADLYGYASGVRFQAGSYRYFVDPVARTIRLTSLNQRPHEALWSVFAEVMRNISTAMISASTTSDSMLSAVAQLMALDSVLRHNGRVPNGSWLSKIRNQVNYRLELGTWYPYQGRAAYYDGLHAITRNWLKRPDSLRIWVQDGRELQRFIEACTIIVAICREMSTDMVGRCPEGRSFLTYGPVRLIEGLA